MDLNICNCGHCQHVPCAKNVPVFSALNDEELGQIVSLIVRKQFSKGDIIPMESSLAKCLIIISSGRIKTFRYNHDGKEQILYIFSEGDFLGEMNILSNIESMYNAEALEDTHICMIRKNDFQKLLLKFPGIGLKIMEELCSRLQKMQNMVHNMSSKDVEVRVNMVLVEFSEKYGKRDTTGITIELPLSREGIANYIGVTRETVSRKLSHLQEVGIIELVGNKKIHIIDEEALKRYI